MTWLRRRPALLLVAAGLSAPLGACGRQPGRAPQIQVAWTLAPATPMVGPASLTVTLHDKSGGPVQGAAVHVEGQMSHAGMPPVLADAAERAPGVYEIRFAYTMAGDWVLLVSAILPDGTRVERRVDVAHVRPAP